MLSVLMLVMGLAPILAPLIGGQLLVNFGWRSGFLGARRVWRLLARHRHDVSAESLPPAGGAASVLLTSLPPIWDCCAIAPTSATC